MTASVELALAALVIACAVLAIAMMAHQPTYRSRRAAHDRAVRRQRKVYAKARARAVRAAR